MRINGDIQFGVWAVAEGPIPETTVWRSASDQGRWQSQRIL